MTTTILSTLLSASPVTTTAVVETRTVSLVQTVTLHDIPLEAGQVRMWVPLPGDTPWQRVLDLEVVSAPGTWRLVPQADGRGTFIYAELSAPAATEAKVVIRCLVEREGCHFPIDAGSGAGPIQPDAFVNHLRLDAPLMEVDDRVRELADVACGADTDPARQTLMLLEAVSRTADHYSTNSTVPTCGRGAAGDCLANGGGCCTDLHSLFISMARARGIPARMQFGYRLLDGREGTSHDPGYRCWVEYFLPGAGWVPTDIVAADAAAPSPHRWGSLSSTRVHLWSGRSFQLTPAANAGPIHTMLCGWAEIDGQPVDPLPAHDGTPSRLRRTVRFDVISNTRDATTPQLPQ